MAQLAQAIPDELIAAVERELPEKKDNSSKLSLKDNINIKVTKECQVDVTFVWSGAGCNWWTGFWDNCYTQWYNPNGNGFVCNDFNISLYYFIYEDGYLPTKEFIDQNCLTDENLVVWNVNQNTSVTLKGNTTRVSRNNYTNTTLQPGECIGWVVTHPAYQYVDYSGKTGITETIPNIYSIPEYNEGGYSQSIRYQYGEGNDQIILYGFEDLPIGKPTKIWGEDWNVHTTEHVSRDGDTVLQEYEPAENPWFLLESDLDYNDILFYVTATSMDAIVEDDIPVLPDSTEPLISEEYTEGTLLYEDLYPYQGDYDMNDVIIQYKLVKYFDENNQIVKLGYEFLPVWDGAQYTSDFYFMIDNGVLTTPVEVFKNHEASLNQVFSGEIVDAVAGMDKDDLKWTDFNPFIYVHESDREVHLTKKSPSPNANTNGLNEVQKLYVNESNYPFAMMIPTRSYVPVTEMVRIEEEYRTYPTWVESDGALANDWYLYRVVNN